MIAPIMAVQPHESPPPAATCWRSTRRGRGGASPEMRLPVQCGRPTLSSWPCGTGCVRRAWAT